MKLQPYLYVFQFVFAITFAVLTQPVIGQSNICEGEQPGDWCDDCPTDPGHNGYNECDTCLNHYGLMQNASTAKTKPRVLYVNDFVTFMTNEDTVGLDVEEDVFHPSTDPKFVVSMNEGEKLSILGNKEREVELLEYACDAGFDGLLLYNVGRLLSKGDTTYYYFDENNEVFHTSSLTYPQELQKFIMIAEQVYDLEVGISTSEAEDTTMWNNANNLYDLQGMNFSWINRQEAFNQNYLYDCGNWGFKYEEGGGLPGGYFEVGDFDPLYPPDNEGNYHPFDYHIVDVVNMQYFNYRSAQSKEEWFSLIWDYIIDQEYSFLDTDNEWCFWKCGKDPDAGHGGGIEPEYRCFQSDFCPGYKRIVTEHEFWQHKDSIIDTFHVYDDTTKIIHHIYDIEKSYNEFLLLLDLIACIDSEIKSNLGDEYCTVKKDIYLGRLTSPGFTYDYYYGNSFNSTSHYVVGSTWVIPFDDLYNYEYDEINREMAETIDSKVDRIYLETYRKTPCHLWSDDLRMRNQSYGRRFKDVYAYFSDNGIGALDGKTDIWPLFSARHHAIEDDEKNREQNREHLGLYLSNSGPYAWDNGFLGSIGGAENIFDHFANLETQYNGCMNDDLTPNPSSSFYYENPYDTLNSPLWIGDTIVQPCVPAGAVILLTGLTAGLKYGAISSRDSEYLTLRRDSSAGDIVAYGRGRITFTPTVSDTYYLHLNRNVDCEGQNWPDSASCRELYIVRAFQNFNSFQSYDPNPDPITAYDNIHGGYAWYRYSELGGINDKFPYRVYKMNIEDDSPANNISDIKIYPNPAQHILRVKGMETGKYEMYDLSGKQIKAGRFTLTGIDVGDLASGAYLLQLHTGESRQTFKVIVQR